MKNIEKPVCPYCKEKMVRNHYVGYYDEFFYWDCKCSDNIPVEEKWEGNFVGGDV